MNEKDSNNEQQKEMNFCPTCNSIVETVIAFSYTSKNTVNEDLSGYLTEVLLSTCLNCSNPFLKERVFQFAGGDEYLNSELQFYPNTEKK